MNHVLQPIAKACPGFLLNAAEKAVYRCQSGIRLKFVKNTLKSYFLFATA
jgi:hypothetical protein